MEISLVSLSDCFKITIFKNCLKFGIKQKILRNIARFEKSQNFGIDTLKFWPKCNFFTNMWYWVLNRAVLSFQPCGIPHVQQLNKIPRPNSNSESYLNFTTELKLIRNILFSDFHLKYFQVLLLITFGISLSLAAYPYPDLSCGVHGHTNNGTFINSTAANLTSDCHRLCKSTPGCGVSELLLGNQTCILWENIVMPQPGQENEPRILYQTCGK